MNEMGEIKAIEDGDQHRIDIAAAPVAVVKEKKCRVASVDVFRGLTVTLMILVDDAGGDWPKIGHAPWNGCNLADFVMPFFLFIVGIAIALALKQIPDRCIATKKVILRTLKLIFWGLLLQGGFSHAPDKLSYGVDMKNIRWCGILQRIALAYFIVGMLEIATQGAQAKELPPARFSIYKLYFWHWYMLVLSHEMGLFGLYSSSK